ncbi:MAG: hypothetical protein WC508_03560 [Patescibacteria group bacterium]
MTTVPTTAIELFQKYPWLRSNQIKATPENITDRNFNELLCSPETAEYVFNDLQGMYGQPDNGMARTIWLKFKSVAAPLKIAEIGVHDSPPKKLGNIILHSQAWQQTPDEAKNAVAALALITTLRAVPLHVTVIEVEDNFEEMLNLWDQLQGRKLPPDFTD